MKNFFLCTVLWVAALTGAHGAQTETRTALIIGISTYSNPEVETLQGVPEDMKSASAIANAMGIAPQNTVVLRDGQATKVGILAALRQLAERTGDGARTFLYYSGHGTRWQDLPSRAGVLCSKLEKGAELRVQGGGSGLCSRGRLRNLGVPAHEN